LLVLFQVFDPSVRQSWPVADALEFAQLALQCLEFRWERLLTCASCTRPNLI